MRNLASLFIFIFSFSVVAQDLNPQILNFKAWKDQQVLTAQNQMLRISARIAQLKGAKNGKADKKDLALKSKNLKTAEVDPILEAEKELLRAQDSLEAANNWTLEDYINVYIPTLRNQPEALTKLTDLLTKEELGEILKTMLVRVPSIDAKQNPALVGGLPRSSQVQTR